jgi:hypothetical protein
MNVNLIVNVLLALITYRQQRGSKDPVSSALAALQALAPALQQSEDEKK